MSTSMQLRLTDQRGVALVLTLWVLVLLSMLALNFSMSTRYATASARNYKESTMARFMAVSAFENTVAYILADPDMVVDYTDEDGRFRTDSLRPPASGIINTAEATIEIRLTDEESRLNINLLDEQSIKRLLMTSGAEESDATAMTAALMDWRDPDSLHRLLGAEKEYYEPMGYAPRNSMLEVPGELLLIRGFSREFVYGNDGKGGMADRITTFGQGLNINTAPIEVLQSLGIDETTAGSLISMRATNRGLRHVPPSLARYGKTFSRVLRVEVRASLRQSPEVYAITALLQREPGADGQYLRTIYWRETIETGGA